MVELLTAYSNNPAALVDLRTTLRVVAEDDPLDDESSLVEVQPVHRWWALADRLSADVLAKLIKSYEQGTTGPALATKYSLSLSSVRRILRAHGVCRRPKTPK